ncbi:MAG: deaminase [Acidimicrobiales bacterium]|nr:deaminase [Acidimicrobiales bacterium]
MSNLNGLPYTPAVAVDGWVIVSGQLGVRDGVLVEDFAGEVRQVIANLRDRLVEHGMDLGHVVKTTCFLADIDQFGEFNEIYAESFPEPRPARSTVEVARLPIGANVEIEALAHRDRT